MGERAGGIEVNMRELHWDDKEVVSTAEQYNVQCSALRVKSRLLGLGLGLVVVVGCCGSP